MEQTEETSTTVEVISLPPWLVYVFRAVLLYPLFPMGALYGEWALAWLYLGHQPIPSANDPKFIDGSNWLHPVGALAVIGIFPACCVASVLIGQYLTVDGDWKILGIKFASISCLWIGAIGLLSVDPWGVMTWWLD